MRTPGRLTAISAVVFGLMLLATAARPLAADGPTGPVWRLAGPSAPVLELFTPSSGGFFARTEQGLLRSDDGGVSWAPVGLPPAPSGRLLQVAVDPANHAVLYASGSEGLYRSGDDGGSWALILSSAESVEEIAISPADPALVYLALKSAPINATGFRLLRSSDGGASWEQLEQHSSTLCGWGVEILQPHPTDAQRIFGAYTCFAGRTITLPLRHSTDRGATWTTLVEPQPARANRLVGGQGSAPARLYLAANRDPRAGGSLLLRSDDDGAGWRELLATPRSRNDQSQTVGPTIQMDGLTYDPSSPDVVYLGLNEYREQAAQRERLSSRVQVSRDGGSSWTALGQQDLGQINDLVLGVDGRNLYAATDRGVWRLPLQ